MRLIDLTKRFWYQPGMVLRLASLIMLFAFVTGLLCNHFEAAAHNLDQGSTKTHQTVSVQDNTNAGHSDDSDSGSPSPTHHCCFAHCSAVLPAQLPIRFTDLDMPPGNWEVTLFTPFELVFKIPRPPKA